MTVSDIENVSTTPAVPVTPENNVNNIRAEQGKIAEKPAPSPAQDLRDIQMLLVQGIFPGQVAPAVVKAYQLLERMAIQIEAPQPQEVK